ncbi:hypothetical protein OE88DRAFT_1810043 [Heliocybe sulcata]|uniref:Tyr recombinase domain-containing protein n=1 Tax=Heliocybe sulcata TaxID=5364 RepID=A0A5C3MYD6_9AGAM|nr:hypothetical protein OE88DRAFT_1810043 [Heliocybe sulcata]
MGRKRSGDAAALSGQDGETKSSSSKRKKEQPSTSKSTRKSKSKATPTITDLNNQIKSNVAQHLQAGKTTAAYDGHIRRGKAFLEDLVRTRRAEQTMQMPNPDELLEKEAANDAGEEVIDIDILAQAFEKPPNRYSALALEMFLSEKCINQSLGESTAEGIFAAFKKMWELMDNETYRGLYSYCPETNRVRGNPAESAAVKDLYQSIRNRCRSLSGKRTHHAEAITIEEVRAIMTWSELKCPSTVEYATITDPTELFTYLVHMEMRAFIPSGYVLWTRNGELCALQGKHIQLDCPGESPYYIPHHEVMLEHRKGWQSRDGNIAHTRGHTYRIYEQSKTPEICMKTHLSRWLNFRAQVLRRPLLPDEFVFPHISTTGMIHPSQPLNHDVVQKLIDSFARDAGLTRTFSTHSFRRGGAQYRFMFAPFAQRWSLTRIRWWGGWADGEQADTLIRYLVDDLTYTENDHSNALCPIPTQNDLIFNGDDSRAAPITAQEYREFKDAIDRRFDEFISKFFALLHGTASIPMLHGHQALHYVPEVRPTAEEVLQNPLMSSMPSGIRSAEVYAPSMIIEPPHSKGSARKKGASGKGTRDIPPIPEASIPDLPKNKTAWREAIRQWEEPNPVTGCPALKDWPKDWYSGSMRLITGAKRGQRQLIANEYNRFSRDDRVFLEAYPVATAGIKHLISAITKARQARQEAAVRRSKYGTPEERG